MKLKFSETKTVTGDVRSFIFEPEQPLSWTPGQYMHYVLEHSAADDRGIERWFTNSAAPFEQHVAITTRINQEKSSTFKKALQALRPGAEIEADGPKGSFVLADPTRNYIFVAGGIGITPFRSMLAQADHDGQMLKVNLLYANSSSDIPFELELNQFASRNSDLKVEYIINPDSITKQLLMERIASVEKPIVYISGPEPMVEDLAEQLKDSGLPEDEIKTDDFPGYESY